MNKFIELTKIKKELAEIEQSRSYRFSPDLFNRLLKAVQDLTEVVLKIAD